LAPNSLAGTALVIPHITGSHKYFVQAPTVTANLTITLGGMTDTLQIAPGTAYEMHAGRTTASPAGSPRISRSWWPHVAYVYGTARDAYPVPPSDADVVGIRSQNVVLGAVTDGTSVTVYASDSSTNTYALDAGDKVTVAVGANAAQAYSITVPAARNPQ
jgi:hypothetical protein